MGSQPQRAPLWLLAARALARSKKHTAPVVELAPSQAHVPTWGSPTAPFCSLRLPLCPWAAEAFARWGWPHCACLELSPGQAHAPARNSYMSLTCDWHPNRPRLAFWLMGGRQRRSALRAAGFGAGAAQALASWRAMICAWLILAAWQQGRSPGGSRFAAWSTRASSAVPFASWALHQLGSGPAAAARAAGDLGGGDLREATASPDALEARLVQYMALPISWYLWPRTHKEKAGAPSGTRRRQPSLVLSGPGRGRVRPGKRRDTVPRSRR